MANDPYLDQFEERKEAMFQEIRCQEDLNNFR